jgi:hypothetical protein
MNDRTKLVNQSGFPLQIGLAHAVDASTSDHGWKVLYQEHAWQDKDSAEFGFIDLVLENRYQTVLLNVECKRPQDAIWQFLLPSPYDKQVRSCKFWASYATRGQHVHFDWLDLSLDPSSYESGFCVVAGQDAKARPMLERVAATVVASTEALAKEEGPFVDVEKLRAYISVIATTAKLEVCKFDPDNIDLRTGTIKEAQYEAVPFIRFRKQLSSKRFAKDPAYVPRGFTWDQMARAKENTVLVVEASEFLAFLPQLELDRSISHRVLGQR